MSVQSYQLSDYLEKLPGTTFRKLYQQPSTAFAIFRRMLPPLAKVFVRAMLYMPGPFPLAQIDLWVKPEAKLHRERALSVLRSLHIITITPAGKDRPQEVHLTTNFAKSFRMVLEGNGDHNSFGAPSTLPVDPTVTVAALDRYARKKWEDILHYVVNSVEGGGHGSGSGPKASVKELLVTGHLVERNPNGVGIAITQAGFTFLLQEANAQVWTLLLLWLEAVDHRPAAADTKTTESIDMLAFLFTLAFTELGQAYDAQALPESRRAMLPALVDFGLVFIPRDTRQYYPTRLATTLTSSASALRSVSAGFSAATADATHDATSIGTTPSDNTKGSVFLETNFRLYCYTQSPLQIAVLALFTNMKVRLPGLVTGRLKRESVRRAFNYGITADQIIAYLVAHAHEHMVRTAAAQGTPVLPSTVVDQIRLWQLETERMAHAPGFMFKEFDSFEEYDGMARYAEEIGVLQFRNDKNGTFFVTKVEQLRDYLKSRKK